MKVKKTSNSRRWTGSYRRPFRYVYGCLLAVSILVLLSACGKGGGAAPSISSFEGSSGTIEAGSSTVLSWGVTGNFLEISLSSDPERESFLDLPASGEVTVSPAETTTYTLKVTRLQGEAVLATFTVTVTPAVTAPVITAFTAEPDSIIAGDESKLSWSVIGEFDSVALSAGPASQLGDDLAATGTQDVEPAETTTYTLSVAYGSGQHVTATATVTVTPEPVSGELPVISAFSASPASISEGGESTLSWNVRGDFTSITLMAGDEEVRADLDRKGTFTVGPTVTTTYTIAVVNPAGDPVTRSATLTVVPRAVAPTITAFTAEPDSITAGETSMLSWNVSGAFTSITLSSDPGTQLGSGLDASDARQVQPGETTTYTLSVAYGSGQQVTETTKVTVTPAVEPPDDLPLIGSFSFAIVSGSQVTLSWTATGANSYEIFSVDAEGEEISRASPAGTATTVTIPIPASNQQTLRLRAINAAGSVEEEGVLTNVVVSTEDYDPYHLLGFIPESPVPGTLRAVLANAESGSVIGFASDITAISLYGVDLFSTTSGWVDAHLILRDDITISGPVDRHVILTGVSGKPATEGSITFQSRVIYTPKLTTAYLENLVVTGGTFIYLGGGIKNDGTLTIRNAEIRGNRAWTGGGGIHNTGRLTISGSMISDNTAAVTEAEGDAGSYLIRMVSGDPYAFIRMDPSQGYGGGIWNTVDGVIELTNTTISGNASTSSGAGIYNEDGRITMNSGSLSRNASHPEGYAHASQSRYGGGAYTSGEFTMNDGSITDNIAVQQGGGLYLNQAGTATLNGVTVTRNTAQYGGGILHQYCDDDASNLSRNGGVVTENASPSLPVDIYTQSVVCSNASALRTLGVDHEPGRYYPSDLIEEWMLGR